jgi:hypothetical protein
MVTQQFSQETICQVVDEVSNSKGLTKQNNLALTSCHVVILYNSTLITYSR